MRLRKSLKSMLHHTPSPIMILARPHRKILLRQPSAHSACRRPSREQGVVTSCLAIEKPRKNDQSSEILDNLETSFVEQSPQIDPGMSFNCYNGSVCKLHKPMINHHDVNRAIEVARGTSAAFTDHVPYCDLLTWLDGLDCLEHLQAHDGSCMECFLVRHLRASVGFPLLVSAIHTGDTEMLKALLHVYESIDNCGEYAMRWATRVISGGEGEKTWS